MSNRVLKTFLSSELGKKLSKRIAKDRFYTSIAPVFAAYTAIQQTDSEVRSIAWIGDTGPIKLDGAKWFGLLGDLQDQDFEYTINILDAKFQGVATPWTVETENLSPVSINMNRNSKDFPEIVRGSDLVIYCHPQFAIDSEPSKLATEALRAGKPVFGAFWSGYDSMLESMVSEADQLSVSDEFHLNPVQLAGSKDSEDVICSEIRSLSLCESLENIDEKLFLAYMRQISGTEGYSSQKYKPFSEDRTIMSPLMPEKFSFVHLLDGYSIDQNSGYVYKKHPDNNSMYPLNQLSTEDSSINPGDMDIKDLLIAAYKVKAKNIFEARLFNMQEAKVATEYFEKSYLEGTGIIEAQLLGARILLSKKQLTKLDNLKELYAKGSVTAGILLSLTGSEEFDNEELYLKLADAGIGEYYLFAHNLNPEADKSGKLIKAAADSNCREAIHIRGIQLIEKGKVHEGLDDLLYSAELGDRDSKAGLPEIISHIKSIGQKQLIPLHHLRNLSKYQKIADLIK